MRAYLFAFLVPLGSCADGGCETDMDCKADRICDAELRACVDPPASAAPDLRQDLSPPGASSLQICVATCDANKRCGVITDAQAASCRATCEAMRDGMDRQDAADDARCFGAAQVRHQVLACAGLECNKIQTCLNGVDRTCVPR